MNDATALDNKPDVTFQPGWAPAEMGLVQPVTAQNVRDALAGKLPRFKLLKAQLTRGANLPTGAEKLDNKRYFTPGRSCHAIVWTVAG